MTFSIDSRFPAYSNKNSLEIRDIEDGGRQQIRVEDDDDEEEDHDHYDHYDWNRDYISRIIFSPDSTMIATHSKGL